MKQFRLWIVIVGLVAVLIVSGCGVAAPGSGSAAAPIDVEPSAPVEIEFWHSWAPDGPQGVVLQTLFDEYNESQDKVHVTGIFMGQQRNEKIAAALAAGDAPDIAWIAGAGEVYFDAEQLLPMDVVFEKAIPREDIIPGLLEGQQYLGQDITLPFENSSLAIYYNQDMLTEAGQEIPAGELGTWTWTDFIQAAKAFSNPDENKYGWDPRLNSAVLSSMFWSAGGQYISDDFQTNLICSEPAQRELMVKSLQRIHDILWKDQITANDVGDQGFGSGNMPFEITGPWAWPRYEGQVNMGVTAFPVDEDTGLAVPYWYQKALAIFRTDTTQEAATLDFLKWFYSPEVHARWSVEAGYLPITISGMEHPTWQENVEANPNVQVFMEQAEVMRRRKSGIPYGDLDLLLDTVKFNEGTPEEAIDNYCQDAQLLLDEFWAQRQN